jgi:hypothetical protein
MARNFHKISRKVRSIRSIMVPLSYYISLIKCVNLWRQKHLLFQRMFFKHASPDCRNINWQQFSYRVYIITTQRASLTTFTFIFVFLKFFYFYRPKCSMYGIFTNICPKNHPNVGKYTIHGSYGRCIQRNWC